MSDYLEAIDRLLEESEAVGFGPTQVRLCEEAVRLADTHGDAEQGFAARLKLIMAANFGGRPDLTLVAFSWCLGQHDRDPRRFPIANLLWKFKWVVTQLPHFPQISREQIEAMLADMEGRFRRAGSTMHAAHHKRWEVLLYLGDLDGAARAYSRLGQVRRDWLSDCSACVTDFELFYLRTLGEDERALEKAQPILRGRLSCAEVPHRTYAQLLLPLVRLGRVPEAMVYHRKGYRLIGTNPTFIDCAGDHLAFLALTDNLAKGVKLLERHLPDALVSPGCRSRFDFFLAARLLLERLAEGRRKALKLRLPPTFPLHDPEGQYPLSDLLDWFSGQLDELARQFDARNGNPFYSDRVAGLQGLKKFVSPCPLSAR